MKMLSASKFVRAAVTAAGCGLVVFGLAACGDDVTEIYENDATAVLESGKKLSKQACDTTNVGELLFVTDSSAVFVCDGEDWAPMNGKKGETGSDGTSCTTEKNSDGDYELTCGEKKVGVVKNCKIASEKDGAVKIVCGDSDTTTVFKGLCGDNSYDPTESFCHDQKLYSCDGKPFNPVSQYCEDKEIVNLDTCGEAFYDKKTMYCSSDKKVLEMRDCNDRLFNPETQYCQNGKKVAEFGSFTDSRDSNTYKTIVVGEDNGARIWMAENLNYDYKMKNNANGKMVSYNICGGGNNVQSGDCDKYGRLYTWAGAIDSVALNDDDDNPQICGNGSVCELPENVRGICPEGWHLPVFADFVAMENLMGGREVAGKKMKSASGWIDDINGTDAFGFNVFPAGDFYGEGSFENGKPFGSYANKYTEANFWLAVEEGDGSSADYVGLAFDGDDARHYYGPKSTFHSIRCVKDAD